MEFKSVKSEEVGHAATFMTLENPEPLVAYGVTVAAVSNKGPGPEGITFGQRSN